MDLSINVIKSVLVCNTSRFSASITVLYIKIGEANGVPHQQILVPKELAKQKKSDVSSQASKGFFPLSSI